MAELHSMAYTTNLISSCSSSLSWNFQDLGVINDDMPFVMNAEGGSGSLFSPTLESDDFSTGYLEDALLEFSENSKRRRLISYSDEDYQTIPSKDFAAPSLWKSSCNWGLSSENFSCTSHLTSINGVSGGEGLMRTSMSEDQEASYMMAADIGEVMKTPDQHHHHQAVELGHDSSSDSVKTNHHKSMFDDKDDTCSKEKMIRSPSSSSAKKEIKRVVYPFAMVKPGGNEGDMTLNDINERILMAPTRPVRHPVGDFACRPACLSAHGPGLSGKAVVALTRIHTHGRGTITIIRTKG